jgi:hypothetical protein
MLYKYYFIKVNESNWQWVVPENIRTPTTGGIVFLPPHAPGISEILRYPRPSEFRKRLPPLPPGIPFSSFYPSGILYLAKQNNFFVFFSVENA